MSNMKLFVFSTTVLMLGIGQASARPVLYAWGGHFDETNGGQAYVINPIEATVLALKGRGQSGGSDIGGPQHHAGFGYERKWFGGGPGGPGSGGVGPFGGGGTGGGGGGNSGSGGSGGSGSGGQSFNLVGGDGGNGPAGGNSGNGSGAGDGGNTPGGGGGGNGPNGPLVEVDPPEDTQASNPPYWTPGELIPPDPPVNEMPSDIVNGVPPPVTTAAVPEPATLGLFGIAFAALGARYRRRKS